MPRSNSSVPRKKKHKKILKQAKGYLEIPRDILVFHQSPCGAE